MPVCLPAIRPVTSRLEAWSSAIDRYARYAGMHFCGAFYAQQPGRKEGSVVQRVISCVLYVQCYLAVHACMRMYSCLVVVFVCQVSHQSSFNREAKNIMLTDASQAIELYTFICRISRSCCIPR